MAVVAHVDLDCFFVQVERARDPSLHGRPIAVQQHQDIIAVSYEARALGVAKHMGPADARAVHPDVRLVHVPTVLGRVTYAAYRAASSRFFKALRGALGAEGVVERGSLDEAFVRLGPSTTEACVAAAAALKAAVLEQTGFCCSVGLAPNKLMAKVASQRAKPDGLCVLESAEEIDAVLRELPIARLPGCGGKLKPRLLQLGVQTAAQLRALPEAQLVAEFGARVGRRLFGSCRGEDPAPVADKGPPQAICAQMALAPEPRRRYDSEPGDMLVPVLIGGPHLGPILEALAADVAQRAAEHHEEHSQWPHTVSVTLAAHLRFERTRSRPLEASPSAPVPALAAAVLAAARAVCAAAEADAGDAPLVKVAITLTRMKGVSMAFNVSSESSESSESGGGVDAAVAAAFEPSPVSRDAIVEPFVCPDCRAFLPEAERAEHADYHAALALEVSMRRSPSRARAGAGSRSSPPRAKRRKPSPQRKARPPAAPPAPAPPVPPAPAPAPAPPKLSELLPSLVDPAAIRSFLAA